MVENIKTHPEEKPNDQFKGHPLKDRLYLGELGLRLFLLTIGGGMMGDSIINPKPVSEYEFNDGAVFATLAIFKLVEHIRDGVQQAKKFSQEQARAKAYSGLFWHDNQEEFLRRAAEMPFRSPIVANNYLH